MNSMQNVQELQAVADCVDSFGERFGRDDETYLAAVRALHRLASLPVPTDAAEAVAC